jgi:hypothetical protein
LQHEYYTRVVAVEQAEVEMLGEEEGLEVEEGLQEELVKAQELVVLV